MSKKKSNNKAALKKVLSRNRDKKNVVPESPDMHETNVDETAEPKIIEPVEQPQEDKNEEVKTETIIRLQPLTGELRQKGIEMVKELWPSMKDKQDLLKLLNVALIMLGGEKAHLFTVKDLNYQAYSSNNKNRYFTFQVPKKKKGEFRTIDAPCAGLKMIQRALNLVFQTIYNPHPAAMGFVENRSIVMNANVHVGQKYIYNIDLKDFFPTITSGRLFARLQVPPFGLNKEIASLITDLCCYENAEHKHVLPQGAPTSPTVTNFICESLDRKLSRLAKAYGMKYTRYADDITFSSKANLYAEDGKFCKSLKHIIEDEEHFMINADKTRLCHQGERQEVTGLTVNEKTNTSRNYIKQVRRLIHYCDAKGLEGAQRLFLSRCYTPKTTRPGANPPHIENVIEGKLLYLKMVKGHEDSTYKNLTERWQKVLNKQGAGTPTSSWATNVNAGAPTTSNNPNPKDKLLRTSDTLVNELNEVLDIIIDNYG